MHFKAVLSLFLFISASQSHAKIVESVMAVVEGQMILKSDIGAFKEKLKAKSLINENLISFMDMEADAKLSDQKILDYLIAKKIITTYALKDLNISSPEDLVNKEIAGLAKQNGITVQQLKKEITSRGIDFQTYREFIQDSSLIRSALEKNVVSQVRPTEDELVNYLKKNGVKGIVPSFVYDLDQIFVPSSLNDAQELAQKIDKENFKEYFASAEKFKIEALKLGQLRMSDLSPTHASPLAKTSSNEVTSVIKESNGFRLFFVNQKKGNYNIPNTPKVRKLQQQYYDEMIKTQFQVWFQEIKPDFFVRING
jgi:peptidyl-prolyl cis-trans isomerase SurA